MASSVEASDRGSGAIPPLGLERLDQEVLRIFTLVAEALAGATEIFLATDRDAARALVARDQLIDASIAPWKRPFWPSSFGPTATWTASADSS